MCPCVSARVRISEQSADSSGQSVTLPYGISDFTVTFSIVVVADWTSVKHWTASTPAPTVENVLSKLRQEKKEKKNLKSSGRGGLLQITSPCLTPAEWEERRREPPPLPKDFPKKKSQDQTSSKRPGVEWAAPGFVLPVSCRSACVS